jgi:hypothetical protein
MEPFQYLRTWGAALYSQVNIQRYSFFALNSVLTVFELFRTGPLTRKPVQAPDSAVWEAARKRMKRRVMSSAWLAPRAKFSMESTTLFWS